MLPFVQHNASGQVFVVGIDLLTELVDELVEAEVDLSLNLVVQKLLLEDGQSVVSTVIVQIERIKDTPEEKSVFVILEYANETVH